MFIYLRPLPTFSSSDFQILNNDVQKKKDQVAQIGVRGGKGLGDSGNARKKTFFSVDVFPKENSNLMIWLKLLESTYSNDH